VTFQTVGLVDALLRYFTAKGTKDPLWDDEQKVQYIQYSFPRGAYAPYLNLHPRSSIAALDPSTTKSSIRNILSLHTSLPP